MQHSYTNKSLKKQERETFIWQLNHPYLIEMGDKSFKCGLKDVPTILSELGCKRNDVLFHQEIPEGYDLLNRTEKFHIQKFTFFFRGLLSIKFYILYILL